MLSSEVSIFRLVDTNPLLIEESMDRDELENSIFIYFDILKFLINWST